MSAIPAQGFNVVTVLQPSTQTASGVGALVQNNQGLNFAAAVQVTQFSGTTPTLNVILQESLDGGATWFDKFHFEQITGDGTVTMPPNQVFGMHRYIWNIGGTTPSFTFQITETGSAEPAPRIRRFFDYTAGLLAGTLNAVGQAFRVDGAVALTATITLAAGGTAGSYQIQVSPDGVNWSTLPYDSPHAAVVGGTVTLGNPSPVAAMYARLFCQAAGAGQTGVVASLSAV